ncbi:MAG TPA: serine/threonine-protein kinase [Blastocatellia bacterium]|nr:serine/threonine-protein kinase [Blastocatellia bacterium]
MKTCPQCATTYDDERAVCPADNTQLIEIVTDGKDPMLGKVLAGRFLLVEKLGQGGMGTVYKAVHTQMDRICALKLLSPFSHDTESAVARFKREARMASRIDNPHAVTIYDFGEAEGGLLYLAMEYIDGKPLTRLLAEEQGMGINRTVHITAQIAQALAAAHTLGIVHRDLKPDNIMIARKGGDADYVKVLDFGIAKTVADDTENVTKTGFILGTPVYMSPEQITGDKLDGRSDVYSLAIIAYEMLSGRLPFEGDNVQAIMIKRVTSDPIRLRQVNPSVSESVEQVVMAGLTRDREKRIATAEAFASLLTTAQHGGTQVMSSPVTNEIAGPGGRQTNPITERHTIISATVEEGFTAANTPEALPQPVPQTAPVASSEQEKPTVDISATPLPPAEQFVTQPSTSFEAIKVDPTKADATRPVQRPAESIPPTFDLHSEPQPQPAAQAWQQPQAQPPQYQQQSWQSATRPVERPQKGSKGVLILAVALVAAVVLIGAAYFIYSRMDKVDQPVTNTSRTQNANSDSGASARTFYENGLRHQKQAYSLESAGSKFEAKAENEKAVDEYKKAIAAKPDYPEAHENLGVAYYSLGRLDEALTEYDTAIRQYGKPTAQVLTNQGMALLGRKLYEEAASSFAAAKELDPNDHDLDYYLGFAHHYSGNPEGAKAAFRRYLANAPSGQYAKEVRDILAGHAEPVIPSP